MRNYYNDMYLLLSLFCCLLVPAWGKSISHQLQFGGFQHMGSQIHSLHAIQLTKKYRHILHAYNLKQNSQQFESPLETDGFSFRIPMKIGGLPYKVNLDTGSSDFMIKGEKTTGQPKVKYNCKKHNCTKIQKQVPLGYLDGFLSCYATQESIVMGGRKFDTEILVAYEADQKFDTVSGICGVSFPQIAMHHPTLIQTLQKQDIIQKYAYGVNFNFLNASRSYITFGQSKPQFYKGKLDMYDLKPGYTLQTDFKWIKFGQDGKRLRISSALFDTGTTCIAIPHKYSHKIISAFQNSNTMNRCYFYKENIPQFQLLICRVLNFDQLPIIEIAVDKIIYSLSKQQYLQYCLKHNGIQYCVTYIERFTSHNSIILGDGFFRKYYGYFDLEGRRIGLAENRQVTTLEDILNLPPQDQYLQKDWQPLNY